MTQITLTFLFHFVITPLEDSKKSKKKEKKGKKEKKKKKEKIAPEIDKEKEDACMTITVNVKKPVSYLHLEYNILPKLPPYKIDVLFWGSVAKVYVNNTAKSIKPIQRNEQHYWIAFSIVHDFTLNLNDLLNLKSHTVNFTITSSKKKIGKVAKKDKVKSFSFWKEDVNTKLDFVQAYEDLVDMEPWSEFQNMLLDMLNFSIEDEFITFLKIFPDDLNCLKSINIIEKIMAAKPVNIFNSEEAGLIVKDLLKNKLKGKKGKGKGKGKGKNKKQKDKKSKKGKKGKSDSTIKFSIPGEIFFTDPSTIFDFKSTNKDIIHAFVVIQVDKLININTIENLYPIIIKIEEIQRLPIEILAKKGFSQMYTTYKIANDDQVSFARSISNNICFKEHHIHFISDLFMLGLVEQLQTGYLVVQIHGITEVKSDTVKPINYANVSKVLQDKNEILDIYDNETLKSAKSVLLAEAHFALDALLNPFWAFTKSVHCQSPDNIYSQQVDDSYKKITINSINLQGNTNDISPITEDVILINNLTLAVEVKLCRPLLYRLRSYQKAKENYNRIILVIYDLNLAKLILTTVMINNTASLENKDILPNYLTPPDDVMPTLTLITGFVIDCRNFYFMFLEGIVYMIENLIWELIKYESVDTLKAFYNSDYIFGDRIYSNFISMGGVLNITLFQPLLMVFNEKKCIFRGFLPEPCRKVLLKLNLILQSQFLVKITSNILPTDKELLSLDLEWGVPLYCTN